MECKSFALAEVKTIDNADAPGSFEAVVSVFGNVDSYGDRMMKGAFARTLAEKGMPPVVWSHEWSTPPIGTVSEAIETDEGLLVKGRLFVGADEDHAVAKQVYAAMKAGALREFSFGYATKGSRDVEEDGNSVREITDVDLFEVGPTLVGANDQTRLVGVKALERAVADEIKTSQATAPAQNEGTEPADKPLPKDDTPVLSEEEAVRIGQLLLERPIHHTPQEG